MSDISDEQVNMTTKEEIQNELNRINYQSRYNSLLKNTFYTVIIVVAISAIISTLVMPVLQLTGNSMNPNYKNGDILISVKTKNLKSGDVVAFYHGNKILVKRIIATSGEWVNIDDKGDIKINDKELDEKYEIVKAHGETDIKYPYQVPNESYFVLSDDRTNSIDSRLQEIGAVSSDDLIGKVIFRVWPIR